AAEPREVAPVAAPPDHAPNLVHPTATRRAAPEPLPAAPDSPGEALATALSPAGPCPPRPDGSRSGTTADAAADVSAQVRPPASAPAAHRANAAGASAPAPATRGPAHSRDDFAAQCEGAESLPHSCPAGQEDPRRKRTALRTKDRGASPCRGASSRAPPGRA